MVIIPKYETSVSLFHVSGEVHVFKTKASALKELGSSWIHRNVGDHFNEGITRNRGCQSKWVNGGHSYDCARSGCYYCNPRVIEWVMRDDEGKVVSYSDFYDMIVWRRKLGRRGHRSNPVWNGDGSVPGIRKWRGGGTAYRPISHMNERRAAIFFKEEGEVAPRGARNVHHLPNNWDDYCRWDWHNKTWKRHRETQWKKAATSYRTIDWDFDN